MTEPSANQVVQNLKYGEQLFIKRGELIQRAPPNFLCVSISHQGIIPKAVVKITDVNGWFRTFENLDKGMKHYYCADCFAEHYNYPLL